MGVQGLRKFIDGSAVTKSVASKVATQQPDEEQRAPTVGPSSKADEGVPVAAAAPGAALVEHVLFDMNCIIHSCFSRSHETPAQTIRAVIERLHTIIDRVVRPVKSLTLCLDGPAPVAKLQTQRLRRRKLSHMDLGNNRQFSDLAITTGSLFMVELENRVASYFQKHPISSTAVAATGIVPVYLFGSTMKGEGESKIAQALALLASDRLHYRTSDQVVVLGNDIDLTLTCLGATPYHNLTVLSPSSLQAISVGELIYRWLLPSSAFLSNVAQLPSTRIDLVFLFLLNGGDHYQGIGDMAVDIWRRYRLVRTQQPDRKLVSDDLLRLDVGLLCDVLQVEQYSGQADAATGLRLLKEALWSTYMTVTGYCPNYFMLPHQDVFPTLCNIKAAASQAYNNGSEIAITLSDREPLTPLATYVALMPTTETLPEGVRQVVIKKPALAQRLCTSNDQKIIAQSANEAVRLAQEAGTLSAHESHLLSFSEPVQVNHVPPTKHMSRNEMHRLQAKGVDPLSLPKSPPEVVQVSLPQHFGYQVSTYKVKELVFRDPFGGSEKRVNVAHGIQSSSSSAKPADDIAAAGGSKRRVSQEDDAVESEIRKFLGSDAEAMPALVREVDREVEMSTEAAPRRKKARKEK